MSLYLVTARRQKALRATRYLSRGKVVQRSNASIYDSLSAAERARCKAPPGYVYKVIPLPSK